MYNKYNILITKKGGAATPPSFITNNKYQK